MIKKSMAEFLWLLFVLFPQIFLASLELVCLKFQRLFHSYLKTDFFFSDMLDPQPCQLRYSITIYLIYNALPVSSCEEGLSSSASCLFFVWLLRLTSFADFSLLFLVSFSFCFFNFFFLFSFFFLPLSSPDPTFPPWAGEAVSRPGKVRVTILWTWSGSDACPEPVTSSPSAMAVRSAGENWAGIRQNSSWNPRKEISW